MKKSYMWFRRYGGLNSNYSKYGNLREKLLMWQHAFIDRLYQNTFLSNIKSVKQEIIALCITTPITFNIYWEICCTYSRLSRRRWLPFFLSISVLHSVGTTQLEIFQCILDEPNREVLNVALNTLQLMSAQQQQHSFVKQKKYIIIVIADGLVHAFMYQSRLV